MSAPLPTAKNWKEHNRLHKEKRKKYQEVRLKKKLQKSAIDKTAASISKTKERENLKKNVVSTISIAVPGSILDNAQSPELRTYLAGQIARAACIYKVDEVIVFDDRGAVTDTERKKWRNDEESGNRACLQLARILQYLECPQYLRKYFFPLHNDLKYAGILNPLDAPHHLRQNDWSIYREGVVTNKPIRAGHGSQINVGLGNDVEVDKVLDSGLRVTVKLPAERENTKKLKGRVVSPFAPKFETGIYWGYSVRLANDITEIFTRSSYENGYDLTIGTSDKGTSIDDVGNESLVYQHALICFGGLAGLEAALDMDSNFQIDDPALLFHHYLNTCPGQGSRTLRTEEAILVTLAELRKKMAPINPPMANRQFENLKIKEIDSDCNE